MRWYEYFEALLPDEPHERHLELQSAAFEFANSIEGVKIITIHMRPSRNAHKILAEIARDHDQIVISNTVPDALPIFLGALDMMKVFPKGARFAVNQHFKEAKRTKADVLFEYLNGRSYDEVVVIGDSDKDM